LLGVDLFELPFVSFDEFVQTCDLGHGRPQPRLDFLLLIFRPFSTPNQILVPNLRILKFPRVIPQRNIKSLNLLSEQNKLILILVDLPIELVAAVAHCCAQFGDQIFPLFEQIVYFCIFGLVQLF